MEIKKSTCQAYYLRDKHTWANFYLDCEDGKPNGTLLIHLKLLNRN